MGRYMLATGVILTLLVGLMLPQPSLGASDAAKDVNWPVSKDDVIKYRSRAASSPELESLAAVLRNAGVSANWNPEEGTVVAVTVEDSVRWAGTMPLQVKNSQSGEVVYVYVPKDNSAYALSFIKEEDETAIYNHLGEKATIRTGDSCITTSTSSVDLATPTGTRDSCDSCEFWCEAICVGGCGAGCAAICGALSGGNSWLAGCCFASCTHICGNGYCPSACDSFCCGESPCPPECGYCMCGCVDGQCQDCP
jgi:hypothetical protein